MATATMYFPSDFLWGSLSAAHLSQGLESKSDWGASRSIRVEKAKDGSGAGLDYWKAEEFRLGAAANLNNNAYRLSLDWSLIEPEPSRFDGAVLERYREILNKAQERGLAPMVTLHHFANPTWLSEKGDFCSGLVVDYFSRYATRACAELGDLVGQWITFNEPVLYIINRYLGQAMPSPNELGLSTVRRAYRWILASHATAFRAMKEIKPEAQIGIAKHYRHINAPAGSSFLERWQTGSIDQQLNGSWWRSLTSGRIGRPFGGGKIPGLAGAFDFIGISYSAVDEAGFSLRPGRYVRFYRQLDPGSDRLASRKISAEGLYRAIKSVLIYAKPIYITANSLPVSDKTRSAFIISHLRELWRAISFCFPIMGYYHDTWGDSFASTDGKQAIGGTAETMADGGRGKDPTDRLYRQVCRRNAISSELTSRFAPHLLDELYPGSAPDPGT